MMALVTELFHVFLFIIVFIVIHILVVHLTDRRLSVNIRQRILVEDGPVIQIRSISRQKHRQLELERRKWEWEEINGTVSTSFHLKYKVLRSCQSPDPEIGEMLFIDTFSHFLVPETEEICIVLCLYIST